MIALSFVKLSPTENTTVLVRTAVPRSLQPAVANRLLGHLGVGGEQVGFIEPAGRNDARLRLQMMGGEFCGNATMSLGAYLAKTDQIPVGQTCEYQFEVSGAKEPVACRITRKADVFAGDVKMPLPLSITDRSLTFDNGLIEAVQVELPGITHLLVCADAMSPEAVAGNIARWNDEIGADALGVLLTDEETGSILPTVYVPASGTVVHERGCGSGTLAYGCYCASKRRRSGTFSVRQPGGTMTATVEMEDGQITGASIAGEICLIAEGTAYIEID